MADITYTVSEDSPENITGFEQYSEQDKNLINSFQVNSVFDITTNYIELHILSLSDELLESNYNYTGHTQLGNAQSAGQAGTSVLTIDPIVDAKSYGYENGGVKLLYHFLNDLYTKDKSTQQFFIQNISPDRLEVALSTLNLTPEELVNYTSEIKNKAAGSSHFAGFRLNFKDNDLVIGTNIDTLDLDRVKVVVVKLYEPLPTIYGLKSTLSILEEVSDSVVYEVDSEIVLQPETTPTLRPANFNIDIADESVVPTQYFDYTELLSYPVSNANNQIYSTVNEKGIDINVDYSKFTDFIHFSSAQERLLNFKYKLDLIESYYTSLNAISGSTTGLQGVSGSVKYYEGLVTGVVSNFDHYERFLYYESGSTSWPKSNTTKPYINQASTTSGSLSWYTDQLSKALYFDETNYNSLLYSIPTYLRDDANNENYLTFVYMVGQHFDNLWLYAKAVTDKYDTDNRLNFGISKDLVAEALKNFGVKLYTSNKSVEDLFTTFIGQAYQSGSEVINYYITGSLTGSNTPIQPTSYDSYQKEVQKRIYHNLPLLLKSKGTERGVRALINCFGIPSDILTVKLYGGRNQQSEPFFGDYQNYTSSLDKVRLDNTGSLVSGSTLSELTSIIKRDKKYTDDLHDIEVGFSPTDNIDRYIVSHSASTFNIDNYLGDPRNLTLDNYSGLYKQAYSILENLDTYDLQDYVRLIKFFDNTVFKMIKDFIPARAVATTGIIIKPNLLNRSKAKSISLTGIQVEYSGSINTAFIEGSHGKAFRSSSQEYFTSYTSSIQTPHGIGYLSQYFHEEPKYNGEFSGSYIKISDGELNRNNIFKIQTPTPQSEKVTFISEFPTNICGIGSGTETFIVTSATQTRNLYLDLVNVGSSGIVFTSASVDITSQANNFTLPDSNYTTHSITASRPTLAGCSGSGQYIINYCDIVTTPGNIPSTIPYGSTYNISSWFTAGRNTSTDYIISWGGNDYALLSPSSYTFYQSPGTQVSVLFRDTIIETCFSTVTRTIVYAEPVIELLNESEADEGLTYIKVVRITGTPGDIIRWDSLVDYQVTGLNCLIEITSDDASYTKSVAKSDGSTDSGNITIPADGTIELTLKQSQIPTISTGFITTTFTFKSTVSGQVLQGEYQQVLITNT